MKTTIIAGLVAVLFSGCLGVHLGVGGGGGGRTTVKNNSTSYDVTLGQQLLDLQKAYESGAITKHQYEAEKKRLMKDY